MPKKPESDQSYSTIPLGQGNLDIRCAQYLSNPPTLRCHVTYNDAYNNRFRTIIRPFLVPANEEDPNSALRIAHKFVVDLLIHTIVLRR